MKKLILGLFVLFNLSAFAETKTVVKSYDVLTKKQLLFAQKEIEQTIKKMEGKGYALTQLSTSGKVNLVVVLVFSKKEELE